MYYIQTYFVGIGFLKYRFVNPKFKKNIRIKKVFHE